MPPRTFSVTYYVVRNPGARRVSVHAVTTREIAQAEADRLNDTHEAHLENLADPAWVAARDAALAAQEAAEAARSDAFAALIARQRATAAGQAR